MRLFSADAEWDRLLGIGDALRVSINAQELSNQEARDDRCHGGVGRQSRLLQLKRGAGWLRSPNDSVPKGGQGDYLTIILPMVLDLRSLPSGPGFGAVRRVFMVMIGVKISSSSLIAFVRT